METSACPSGGGRGVGLQVADIFRRFGAAYASAHPLPKHVHKVLRAVIRCRTAALGGHIDVCSHCGFERPAYNSCRNRHCPSCQAGAQEEWIAGQRERTLDTHYFHVVFTLPEPLRGLAQRNPKLVYDALFAAASETLLLLGRQRLDATLGITMVLHTWTRAMLLHPHVHCIVTGGGLSLDRSAWVHARPNFLFPVAVMRALFRGKLLARLDRLARDGELDLGDIDWACVRRHLYQKAWVVYAKRTFGGPEHVIEYLGRYTHRVAISSSRIQALTDDAVTFRTRGDDTVTVTPDEFIRRFLLHVLPPQFRKIRHFGMIAASNIKTLFRMAADILGTLPPAPPSLTLADVGAEEVCPSCRIGTLVPRHVPIDLQLIPVPRWRDTS